jgi:hypothetical protein
MKQVARSGIVTLNGNLLLICAIMMTALSGCGLDDYTQRLDTNTDQKACRGFGFTPGTVVFAQCMEQQAAQRAEQNQRTLDRMQRDEAAAKRGNNKK